MSTESPDDINVYFINDGVDPYNRAMRILNPSITAVDLILSNSVFSESDTVEEEEEVSDNLITLDDYR